MQQETSVFCRMSDWIIFLLLQLTFSFSHWWNIRKQEPLQKYCDYRQLHLFSSWKVFFGFLGHWKNKLPGQGCHVMMPGILLTSVSWSRTSLPLVLCYICCSCSNEHLKKSLSTKNSQPWLESWIQYTDWKNRFR